LSREIFFRSQWFPPSLPVTLSRVLFLVLQFAFFLFPSVYVVFLVFVTFSIFEHTLPSSTFSLDYSFTLFFKLVDARTFSLRQSSVFPLDPPFSNDFVSFLFPIDCSFLHTRLARAVPYSYSALSFPPPHSPSAHPCSSLFPISCRAPTRVRLTFAIGLPLSPLAQVSSLSPFRHKLWLQNGWLFPQFPKCS